MSHGLAAARSTTMTCHEMIFNSDHACRCGTLTVGNSSSTHSLPRLHEMSVSLVTTWQYTRPACKQMN